ncbi:MAG: hypothetical protein P4M08_09180 [Oligoflexia bacterium]|nr:hypothetical protein [Oligoflexia bacterium]
MMTSGSSESAETILSRFLQQTEHAKGEINKSLSAPDQVTNDPQCVEAPEIPHVEPPRVEDPNLETAQSCGKNRDYLEEALSQVSPTFTQPRDASSTGVPSQCVSYVMSHYNNDALKGHAGNLARCRTPGGYPSRGNFKPCVTGQYVNVVANTFADVSSCLGLPAKDIIPQIFQESNFEIDALGVNYDAGIGQLTAPAIDAVNTDPNLGLEYFKQQAASSTSRACKNIAPYVEQYQATVPGTHRTNADLSARCEFISAPDNPLKNLFYLAIFYKQNFATAQRLFDAYDISMTLKRSGFSSAQVEKLEEMSAILGYNAGGGTAVILLKNYLDSRPRGKKLTIADFEIPSQGARQLPGSFSQYLLWHQSSGSRGYLNGISDKARILNHEFKAGTCASDPFLSL